MATRRYLTRAEFDTMEAQGVPTFFTPTVRVAELFEQMGLGSTEWIVVPDGDPRAGTVEEMGGVYVSARGDA